MAFGLGIATPPRGATPFASGAVVAHDWIANKHRLGAGGYARSGFTTALLPALSITRAAPATTYAPRRDGVLVPYAANVARYTDLGVLMEPSRQNIQIHSNLLTNTAGWNPINGTVAANAQVGPDNSGTMFLVTATSSGNRIASQGAGVTVANATNYTSTFYMAEGSSRYGGIVAYNTATAGAIFDLRLGVVVSTAGSSVVSAAVRPGPVIGGVRLWRCSLTFLTTGTTVTCGVGVSDGSTYASSIYPSAASGTVLAGFTNFEAGSWATSYIPTTTVAVTRSADAINATGLTLPTEGTVVVRYLKTVDLPTSTYNMVVGITDGTANNRVMYLCSEGSNQDYMEVGASGQSQYLNSGTEATTETRIAMRYGLNDFAVARMGTIAATDTSGPTPSTLNRIDYGYSGTGASQLSGFLQELYVYPFKMTDAQLIAASTLGPDMDLQFAAKRYYIANASYDEPTSLPSTTFSRALATYATTVAGLLTSVASGALARSDAGAQFYPSRINIALQSQTFDSATYPKTRASITANAATAPDGTVTADLLVEDATASNSHVLEQQFLKAASAVTYTASIYLRPGGRNWAAIQANDGSTAATAYFNIATGVVGTVGAGGYASVSASITPAANGFYRCAITYTTPATTVDKIIVLACNADNSPVYTGDGVSGVYLWGLQKEAGSYATSYMPTTTVAVTRPADVLVTAEIAPPVYTIVAEVKVPTVGPAFAHVWTWDQGAGAASDRVILYYETSTDKFYLRVDAASINQVSIEVGTVAAGATAKIAARIAANDVAVSLNGAAVSTDTSVTVPSLTHFTPGNSPGLANDWGAGLKRLTRWNYGKTNEELQRLAA